MIRLLRLSSPALVALVVATAAAAALSKPLVTDPRDAGGKLDLRAATRIGQDRSCRVAISTWGTWSSTILEGGNYVPGKNKLLVLYDLNGDGTADLTGYVIFRGDSIDLFVSTSDGNLPPGQGKRLTPSSVEVPVCQPLFDLVPIPRMVRVAFESVNRTHRDRMPDRGWIRLRFL
jgi:hypothetical protein